MILEIVLLLYCLLILGAWILWKRIDSPKTNSTNPAINISVVIAVRNEEENILPLLKSLSNQDFPSSQFEIIFIDDHSDDQTYNIISNFIKEKPNFNLYSSPESQQGKKSALAFGIQKSKHDYILCTDGDCTVPQTWVRSFANYQSETKKDFISGPVIYSSDNSIFQAIQKIEFYSYVAIGGIGVSIRKPNMCNGANLFFKKELYLQVNGYSDNLHLASGDDEFLLHKVAEINPKTIGFLKSEKALVTTKPNKNFNELINQRLRWASKWSHYSETTPKLLGLLVFMFHCSFLISLYFAINKTSSLIISFLVLKWVLELLFLKSIANTFKQKLNIIHYTTLSFVYSLYVVYFALMSRFVKSFNWKTRHY